MASGEAPKPASAAEDELRTLLHDAHDQLLRRDRLIRELRDGLTKEQAAHKETMRELSRARKSLAAVKSSHSWRVVQTLRRVRAGKADG